MSWTTTRLFLHVLAATVWVGGQITLGALVPVLRQVAADAPRAAARRFGQVAWAAYGVLLATGAWNVLAEWERVTGRYATTLGVKVGLVAVSGLGAAMHARARTPAGLAVWGAVAATSALGALFVGVLLGTGHDD